MSWSSAKLMRRIAILALTLPLAASAQDLGTATLIEGPLQLIRGTAVMRAAEGVKLRRGDIIETAASGFAQLELAGAVVALGPSTQVYFLRQSANGAELAVLDGWIKAEVAAGTRAYTCASPVLAATTRSGAIVMRAAAENTAIFIESGAATVDSVTAAGSLEHSRSAKAGQFFSRRAGQEITTAARPAPAFLETMPRPFRDTLPSRLARFSGKSVAPRREHEVSYSEIRPWLTASQAWRRGFVERFQPRLKDAEFRKAVDAHMREHPEWDPVLHPEKYEPKANTGTNPSPGEDNRR